MGASDREPLPSSLIDLIRGHDKPVLVD